MIAHGLVGLATLLVLLSCATATTTPTTDRQADAARAALPALAPTAVDDEPCLAMSADGRHTAFLLASRDNYDTEDGDYDPDAEETVSIQWFGPDPLPEPDVDCLLDACTPAALAALNAAGLRGCAKVAGAVLVDGASHGLSYRDDQLWLTTPPAPARSIHTFSMAEHDGGDHEHFEAAYQHPAGGPVFVLVTNEDTGLYEERVEVLAEADLRAE